MIIMLCPFSVLQVVNRPSLMHQEYMLFKIILNKLEKTIATTHNAYVLVGILWQMYTSIYIYTEISVFILYFAA